MYNTLANSLRRKMSDLPEIQLSKTVAKIEKIGLFHRKNVKTSKKGQLSLISPKIHDHKWGFNDTLHT